MCHFVTTTLAGGMTDAEADAVARRHGRVFERLENPHVLRQLAERERYFVTREKACDCGTALGSARESPLVRADLGKQVAKLRRKGWSETKIERWKRDRRKSEDDQNRRFHAEAERLRSDTETWLALLGELLASREVRSVGVLLHWYAGSLEDERIELARTAPGEPRAEFLETIEEDVLYRFADAGDA